jgi:hypothetical protein
MCVQPAVSVRRDRVLSDRFMFIYFGHFLIHESSRKEISMKSVQNYLI